jgi:hypothetical protein
MSSFRIFIASAAFFCTTQAFADRAPLPPPDFGDCTAEKQKKSPSDDCQECNDPSQEGCEKQWKNQGYTRSCQVKPDFSGSWREVWCKNPAATKEPSAGTPPKPTQIAPESTKAGGCAINPEGSASWLWVLGVGFVVSRRKNRAAHHKQ